MWRAIAFTISVLAIAASSIGCGANIQVVYEGHVRFEHCMALDWRQQRRHASLKNKDLGERRQCWVEWVGYYTYGQTRDRVLHAQKRIRELTDPAASPSGRLPVQPPASRRPQAKPVRSLRRTDGADSLP